MSNKTTFLLSLICLMVGLCAIITFFWDITFCWKPIFSKTFKDYAITGQITATGTLQNAFEENNLYVIEANNGKTYNCYSVKGALNSVSEAARPHLGDRIEVTLSRDVKNFDSYTKDASGMTVYTQKKAYKITAYKILTPLLGITSNLRFPIMVEGILQGGPADKAGLMIYDVITEINGEYNIPLKEMLNKYKPGDEISVKIHRDSIPISAGTGEEITIKLILGDRNQL